MRRWRRKFAAIFAKNVLPKRFYAKLEKLKTYKNKQKIRVIFLVNDTAKWQYQTLYEAMAKSNDFDPLVIVSKPDTKTKREETALKQAGKIYDFFHSRNMNVEYGYCNKKGRDVDLRKFNPDIIFHKNPYGLGCSQDYINTSSYALNCYVPYTLAENSMILREEFINSMFKYFVINEDLKQEYEEFFSRKLPNIIPSGHSKADITATTIKNEKYTIIYAPHHSFGKKGLRWATFEWNGELILELARNNPQCDWVFKPHPQFAMRCEQFGIMNNKEIKAYFAQWEKIGKIHEDGDYYDIFAKSNLMITDCGSFLIEYLAFNKPVIHLLNDYGQMFDSVMEKASAHYYKTKNKDELLEKFDTLVHKNNDYLAEERKKDMESFNFSHACDNNIRYI